MSIEEKMKEGEEKTPAQPASTEETKADESKEVEPSKKSEDETEEESKSYTPEELALLEKKAVDYDGMIEKKRLERLNKKDVIEVKPPEDTEENKGMDEERVKQIANEIADKKIQAVNQGLYEDNLTQAYKKFKVDNPWADTDEAFGKISDAFKPGDSISADSLVGRLNIAAQDVFPGEYAQAQEDRIRGQILREKENINTGDISGASGASKGKESAPPAVEKKFFNKKEDITTWYKKPEDK